MLSYKKVTTEGNIVDSLYSGTNNKYRNRFLFPILSYRFYSIWFLPSY
jgi:hypothetical protein